MSKQSNFFIEQLIGGITILLAILTRFSRKNSGLDARRKRRHRWFGTRR